MQKIPSIVDILWRYQQREPLSSEDEEQLRNWLRESEENELLFDDLSNHAKWEADMADLKARDSRATWNRIRERVKTGHESPVAGMRSWKKYATVAAIFAAAVFGTYLLLKSRRENFQQTEESQAIRFKNDVQAGIPQATLRLASGKLIRLDTARAGNLAIPESIWKTDSNSLVLQGVSGSLEKSFNTLTTPNGTQYQITLADGSRVWLNAGSSLQFPSVFSGNERRVVLTGEGYFEVAKNLQKPFLVQSGLGLVRVMGTHFNVRNYSSEQEFRTSLLEGLVCFKAGEDSVLLRPGQQSVLTEKGKVRVDSTDTRQAVVWREHLFWFQAEPFEEIMGEIARWYPIQVVYKGKIDEHFSGILPRNRSLIETLRTLELAGYVYFIIEGNEVQVIPRKT
ncbi:MAG: FecR domain-containing protein [Bacteroidota bacterium]|nr:FecR domain-containing protein [Bacteroidota bacterium]MDP4212615.1 FecR domain-containing protein [Bacteroidota bacterium]MDP4248679.1 FecR domain-containing protein [Bacteroidota bacterium]